MVQIIEPSAELVPHPPYDDHFKVMEHLELIGRTAYQSFDKHEPMKVCSNCYGSGNNPIKDKGDSAVGMERPCSACAGTGHTGTAERFCKMILDRKHYAVFEHYWYAVETPFSDSDWSEIAWAYRIHPYFKIETPEVNSIIIAASLRTWLELVWALNRSSNSMWSYAFAALYGNVPEIFGQYFSPSIEKNQDGLPRVLTEEDSRLEELTPCSIRFVCNRGVTHELVRHRPPSYLQESTRFCNYSKDKFGREIKVIKPHDLKEPEEIKDPDELYKYELGLRYWEEAMANAEDLYTAATGYERKAQHARGILPIDLKTEIVTTATLSQWRYMFGMRYFNKHAHPQIREVFGLAKPLIEEHFGIEIIEEEK